MFTLQTCDLGTAVCLCLRKLVSTRLEELSMITPQTCDLGTAVCLCLRTLVSTKTWVKYLYFLPNMWSRHCHLSVPKKACFNKTWANYPWLQATWVRFLPSQQARQMRRLSAYAFKVAKANAQDKMKGFTLMWIVKIFSFNAPCLEHGVSDYWILFMHRCLLHFR